MKKFLRQSSAFIPTIATHAKGVESNILIDVLGAKKRDALFYNFVKGKKEPPLK